MAQAKRPYVGKNYFGKFQFPSLFLFTLSNSLNASLNSAFSNSSKLDPELDAMFLYGCLGVYFISLSEIKWVCTVYRGSHSVFIKVLTNSIKISKGCSKLDL